MNRLSRLVKRVAVIIGHPRHERPAAFQERAARDSLGYSSLENRESKVIPLPGRENFLRQYLSGAYDPLTDETLPTKEPE